MVEYVLVAVVSDVFSMSPSTSAAKHFGSLGVRNCLQQENVAFKRPTITQPNSQQTLGAGFHFCDFLVFEASLNEVVKGSVSAAAIARS